MKFITLTKIGVAVLGGLAMALGAEAQEPQAGSGSVASLTHVQGTVLVNHGKDYVTARPGTLLSPGARVLTMDKSSASVTYKGSCVKQIKENGLLIVRGPADCGATGAVKSVGPFYAAAIGSEVTSDAGSRRDCDKEGEDGERCCDKEGEEREQCCRDNDKERNEGDEERDSCCCVVAFWSARHLPAAAVIGAGAVIIYNSNRNDRGVSQQ